MPDALMNEVVEETGFVQGQGVFSSVPVNNLA